MAKQKKGAKVKEPVAIRQKLLFKGLGKLSADERAAITIDAKTHPHRYYWSLYLDIYKDGKRTYKFLEKQLMPEIEGDTMAKIRNANTLNEVTQIKAQEILKLESEPLYSSNMGKMLFVDWLCSYKEKRAKTGQSSARASIIECVRNIAQQYQPTAKIKDIDKNYILGFVDFMQNDYKTKGQILWNGTKTSGKKLAKSTIKTYFDTLNAALNLAEKERVISKNPIKLLEAEERVKKAKTEREFLTIDEVKTLINTPCKNDIVKQAFLFSCFCGLRYSDIIKLKWCDIYKGNNGMKARVIMKKTGDLLDMDLSKKALEHLPKRNKAADSDTIYKLPVISSIERILAKWAKAAGINKKVTFHTARHTFATMMLTLGADLYTTSKLLGHSDIKTTQIYAKIVDEKKREAVNLVNDIF